MTTDARERLRQQLIVDEGLRLKPYVDTVGKVSIGIGRNLTDVGISATEAYVLLENDIDKAILSLIDAFPWTVDLNPPRFASLVNLSFNLGITKLSKFVNTMAAIQRGNWNAAAAGLRNSLWYRQVQRSRSERLIGMILSGRWPDEQKA